MLNYVAFCQDQCFSRNHPIYYDKRHHVKHASICMLSINRIINMLDWRADFPAIWRMYFQRLGKNLFYVQRVLLLHRIVKLLTRLLHSKSYDTCLMLPFCQYRARSHCRLSRFNLYWNFPWLCSAQNWREIGNCSYLSESEISISCSLYSVQICTYIFVVP